MNVSVNRPSNLTPMPSGGNSRGDQGGLVVVFLVLLFATFLFSANSSSGQRSAIAAVVALLLFPLVWLVPRAGVPAVIAYLMVMGGFRRALIPILGYTELDPLLLVSPIVATICFVNFLIHRQLRPTTQLGKWTIALMACMGLAVFNPLQGNPLVGLTGAAFYLVPLMWYCIGRRFGNPRSINIIVNVTLFTICIGAVYGLKQHFFGFSDAELRWFQLSTFSNRVGGTERAMSFYTSPGEYANFLAIGIVIAFGLRLRGQKYFILLSLFLGYALLLTGVRGAVFNAAGACTVLWAMQGRTLRAWLPRIIAAVLIVGVGGFFGAQQIGVASKSVGGGNSGAEMVNHQVEGLTDPFGEKSTAQGHVSLIFTGILSGIRMPIGYGLGASTMGAGRFGGSTFFNAEYDLGSMFFSLGAIGGIAFIGTMIVVYRATVLYWHSTRNYAPLFVMGILVASNGSWLVAGNYAQSVLVWTLIGCLDSSWRDGTSVPGFIQKLRQNKSPSAIWKNALLGRLKGVSPSWGASYRRAKGRPEPAQPDSSDLRQVNDAVVVRLTPSAVRALARTRTGTGTGQANEWHGEPHNQEQA